MHLKQNRLVALIELWLSKKPPCNVGQDFTKLIDIAVARFKDGNAVGFVVDSNISLNPLPSQDERDIIYIADVEENDKYVAFLFHRGMPGESTPNWLNVNLKKVLSISPNDRDAVPARSAHLIVLKDKTSKKGNIVYFRSAFERVSGISRLLMLGLLKQFALDYAKSNPHEFAYTKYDKKLKREVEAIYAPSVQAAAHPSQNLSSSIEKGHVTGLEIVQIIEDYKSTDQDSEFSFVKKTVRTKISVSDKEQLYNKIKGFVNEFGGQNAETVKVLLETPTGPVKAPVSLSEVAVQDAKDILYTKSVEISGFSKDLPSCETKVNLEVRDKILEKLYDLSLWSY